MIRGVKIINRLRNKDDFDLVYKDGKVIISSDRKIKITYIFNEKSGSRSIKTAVTVSSKAGKAVWRNRFKRVVNEALIHEKEILKEVVMHKKSGLLIIFSPYSINQISTKKIYYRDVHAAIIDILIKLKKTTTGN